MTNLYHLYCDESHTDRGSSFYLGALICSAQRASILQQRLKQVKTQYNWSHEMKFSKLPKFQLHTYLAYIQVFLDDPYSQFVVTEVKKGNTWTNWATNEEERFFKSYYVFLKMNIPGVGTYNTYNLYLDYKPSKWYRWSSLQHAINNGLSKSFDTFNRKFVHVYPVDSKQDDLIQLVDVLLGAISTNASGPAKTETAQFVRFKLGNLTKSYKPKFTVRVWTPNLSKTKRRTLLLPEES